MKNGEVEGMHMVPVGRENVHFSVTNLWSSLLSDSLEVKNSEGFRNRRDIGTASKSIYNYIKQVNA